MNCTPNMTTSPVPQLQPLILRSILLRCVMALVLGYLQAISIATPWSGEPLWWLQMLSLAGLVMLLERTSSAKQAAWVGWLFALSWLCGTVWWLFISMHIYGGLAAPLAVLAVVALCGFLSLYYAAASYFYKRFRLLALTKYALSAIVFASLWMLAELARDSWFTGFPWGAGGYAHVDGPFALLSPMIGVYGLGFLVSLYAALGAQKKWLWFPVLLLLLSGPYLPKNFRDSNMVDALPVVAKSGSVVQPYAGTPITLLQGNIPQGEKFDATTGVKESLSWYKSALLAATSSLVITPETAIPLLPRQLPDGYWDEINTHFNTRPAHAQQAALIGIPLGDFDKGYTNSVLGLKPNQAQPYQYDKHHLVPFGEFIPPLFKWFTQMMNIPLGDFNRGAVGQPSFEWAGQRWAPNICYEDLFGDELARRFVDEKTAPTVMVNVTSICRSAACARWSSVARWCAPPTRAPP
jgi:apolipoprotein N-acyltransferase